MTYTFANSCHALIRSQYPFAASRELRHRIKQDLLSHGLLRRINQQP